MLPDGRRAAPGWGRCLAPVVAQTQQGDVYCLTLQAPEVARSATPGQFVNLLAMPGGFTGFDPLLRRPLSIARLRREQGEITVIYRALGRGTRLLAQAVPGQRLDLLGPLGLSFPDPARGAGTLALVGGGLGIPPMIAAAEWAQAAGRPAVALVGARSADLLAGADLLRETGVSLTITTDDGSAGERALVTAPLAAALTGETITSGPPAGGRVDEIWACGPEPMLRAVKALAAQHGVPCYLSLERYMACGFGVCIGCTVPRAGSPGYLKCCVDGPVLPAGEVDLG